jgi:hypothetical protein
MMEQPAQDPLFFAFLVVLSHLKEQRLMAHMGLLQVGCAQSTPLCISRPTQQRHAETPSFSSHASIRGGHPFKFDAPGRQGRRGARCLITRVAAEAVVVGEKGAVAVTGATGLIGISLVKQLVGEGYSVRVLTRNVAAARAKLAGPGVQFVAPVQWAAAVRGTVAVINLAGEPIGTRWTPEVKAEIKRSRVGVTTKLVVSDGREGGEGSTASEVIR